MKLLRPGKARICFFFFFFFLGGGGGWVFITMECFNGLQQKEITIYKKINIKTALDYINVK